MNHENEVRVRLFLLDRQYTLQSLNKLNIIYLLVTVFEKQTKNTQFNIDQQTMKMRSRSDDTFGTNIYTLQSFYSPNKDNLLFKVFEN